SSDNGGGGGGGGNGGLVNKKDGDSCTIDNENWSTGVVLTGKSWKLLQT
ncbi:MAG: hypothetical protein HY979_02140, partial [Candidatus Magasanikbacteria bacterium]|nr:hypothetical protein [Candidatus Magasanikbacteria bacterium]